MAMTPRLDLRQTQTLVMTPQLQQAIKLLQLSNMELLAYVEQEIEQNPLLERDDGENDGLDQAANGEGGDAEREEAGSDGSNAGEADPLESVDRSVANDRLAPEDGGLDVDYDNVWTNDSTADRPAPTAFEDWGSRGGGGFDGAEANLEETLSGKDSLGDHLLRQLHMDIVDPVDRLIGLHLFDMLDEAGYITGELAQVAGILDCDVARVELTLASLQQFRSRPASSPAAWPSAWRCSCATATAWIRPCRPCWTTWTSWPGATSRRSPGCAAWTPRKSPTWWRKSGRWTPNRGSPSIPPSRNRSRRTS